MRTESSRRRLFAVLLVAMVATACSGGGGSGTKQGAGAVDPAMVTKAQNAVLRLSDFPNGWKDTPDDGEGGLQIERLWEELTRCLGVDTAASRTGLATSPTFLRGLATQARSTVEYTSAPAAAAIGAALDGPKFPNCAKEAFAADVKRSAPEGGVPGPVAVAPLDVPRPTPKTYSYRVNVTINLSELQVPLFQDFLVMIDGGKVIRTFFLNPGSEFPKELERALVEKVVGRA